MAWTAPRTLLRRLGLMVRPVEWVAFNSDVLEEIVGQSALNSVPGVLGTS